MKRLNEKNHCVFCGKHTDEKVYAIAGRVFEVCGHCTLLVDMLTNGFDMSQVSEAVDISEDLPFMDELYYADDDLPFAGEDTFVPDNFPFGYESGCVDDMPLLGESENTGEADHPESGIWDEEDNPIAIFL